MRGNRIDYSLVGRRFGRLTVIDLDYITKHGNSYWICECDCGTIKSIARFHLLNGHTTSCGCYKKERATIHGQYYSPVYNVWRGMIERCTNKEHMHYNSYGSRGIDVCDEWKDVKTFTEWALNNGYAKGLTLDRINNDSVYAPDNCRWVNWYIQENNRSNNRHITYKNETHTVAEWSRILNIKYATLRQRIGRGDMRDFEDYFDKLTEEK